VIAAERLRRIGDLLLEDQFVSILSLSQMLGVSPMTIRRDLKRLEGMGICERTHGGAVARGATFVRDIPYNARESLFVEEKATIGRRAAQMVQEGETIAIDGGTTTVHMAAALRARQNITVITNSLHVMNQLSDSRGITVISTGGTLSTAMHEEPGQGDPCLVGPLAEANMRRFRPSKAFMATTGITLADGLSNEVLEQATMKLAMIESCAQVILLADHTKFGHVAASIVGPVSLVHQIVVDSGLPDDQRRAFEQAGVEVIKVEPLPQSTGDLPAARRRAAIRQAAQGAGASAKDAPQKGS